MTKRKTTRSALLMSALSMVLCMAMLVGSTFAWFTDSVTSGKNRIIAGNLDVELEYAKEFNEDGSVKIWESVQGIDNIFNPDVLWEPGHAEVVYLRLRNAGSLALKYNFTMSVKNAYFYNVEGKYVNLSQFLQYGMIEGQQAKFNTRDEAINAVINPTPIAAYSDDGNLLEQGEKRCLALVVFMPSTVGNEANRDASRSKNAPAVELDFSLVATQVPHEEDSFGSDYDKNAWDGKMVDTTWYNETESEFEIDSLSALAGLASITKNADTAGKTFKLNSDFDLEGKSLQIQNFEGTFDGNGHEIKGVKSTLFTYPKGTADDFTVVKNLTVTGNTTNTALVATYPCFATFENITVNGTVKAYKAIGGLISQINLNQNGFSGDIVKVIDCVNNADVTISGTSYQAGGIVGYIRSSGAPENTVSIENCVNNGAIYAGKNSGGGIVGLSCNTKIERCYNTGAISGVDYIGGIVGNTNGANSSVVNCYNTGSVTATDNTKTNVGGIVGLDSYGALIVDSCYSIGKVSGGAKNSGIVGNTAGTGDHYTKCYYLEGSAEQGYGAPNKPDAEGKYVSKTDEEMKTKATFVGWDTGIWSLKDGSYPTLIAVNGSNLSDDFMDNEFEDSWGD